MSNQLSAKIQLGDVVFDTVQRQLIHGETVTLLEPKVYDLLCYLVAHSQRFVSLAELHQEVWTGRVVTDTAVRRTISKLRAALGDTDSENPRYLKTQMKLGYQLLLEPASLPFAAPLHIMSDDSELKSTTQTTQLPESLSKGWAIPVMVRYSLLILALIVSLLAATWWLTGNTAHPVASGYDVVLEMPGAKSVLSVSQSGEWLTFTGMLDNDNELNIYLLNTQTGAMQRIPAPAAAVPFSEFVQNDKQLLYGSAGEQHAFYLQPLPDLSLPARQIDTSEFALIGYPVALGDNEILFSASRNLTESLTYYRYNILTEQWTPFSYNHRAGQGDMKARVSADGQKLALMRVNFSSDVLTQILIFDVSSAELLKDISFPQYFFNLEWLSDNQLVLTSPNFDRFLYQLDIETEQLDKVDTSTAFAELRRSKHGDWFAIYAPNVQAPRFNLTLLDWQGSNQRIFSLPERPLSMTFSQQQNHYWLVERDEEQFNLFLYNGADGNKTKLFSHPERFRVLDQHPEQALLLLRIQNRLALLNTETGEYQYISSSQQDVFDGHFQQADNAINFTEQVSGKWQVSRFDLQQQRQTILLRGYRYLAAWQQQYVAVDQQGQFWLLAADYSAVQKLPLQLGEDISHMRVFLQQDNVIAINYTTELTWQLSQLDLVTRELQQTELPVRPVRSAWEISIKDGELLYANWTQVSSPIVRFHGPPLK